MAATPFLCCCLPTPLILAGGGKKHAQVLMEKHTSDKKDRDREYGKTYTSNTSNTEGTYSGNTGKTNVFCQFFSAIDFGNKCEEYFIDLVLVF